MQHIYSNRIGARGASSSLLVCVVVIFVLLFSSFYSYIYLFIYFDYLCCFSTFTFIYIIVLVSN